MSQPFESRSIKGSGVAEDVKGQASPGGSLKGDAPVTIRTEKELAYGLPKTAKVSIPQSSTEKWILAATIAGGWVVAVVFAVAHDRYCSQKNGTPILDNTKSSIPFISGGQDSVKSVVNALTRGVVLSLVISAGAILTQMAWRIPSKRPVSLEQLDQIFLLPSPISTIQLLFSSLFRYIVPIALLVIGIQALELVTIMAPQSLKVTTGLEYMKDAPVSSLDLSQGTVTSAEIFGGRYMGPSASWMRAVQKVMLAPSQAALTAPPNCEAGCSYTINYTAPAIQCRDLSASELTPLTPSGPQTLYNGTSTLWPNPSTIGPNEVLEPYFTINSTDKTTNYSIRIEWSALAFDNSNPSSAVPESPLGVECDFVDATYSTFVWFNGTVQYLKPTFISIGSTLSGPLANQPSCDVTPNPNRPCWVTGMNYRATAEAFSKLIIGTIVYNGDGALLVTSGTPNLTPLFDTNMTVLPDAASWTFNRTVPSISATLVDMFCNVTLGLIAARQDPATVDVTYSPVGNVWEFDDWVLWSLYGPTLLIFALFAIYGLRCISQDGPAYNTFSNYLVATRGESIDNALSKAGNRDAMMHVRLKYTKRGEFDVV